MLFIKHNQCNFYAQSTTYLTCSSSVSSMPVGAGWTWAETKRKTKFRLHYEFTTTSNIDMKIQHTTHHTKKFPCEA